MVVISGGGPIGILVALVARERGARVIVSEINEKRVEKIDTLGLETINLKNVDLVERPSTPNQRSHGGCCLRGFWVAGPAWML